MRCLHCGKALPLLKRLSGGEFCSDAHRLEYQREYSQLALSRLAYTKPPASPEPLRQPLEVPTTARMAGPAKGAGPAPAPANAPTAAPEAQNRSARSSSPAPVAKPLAAAPVTAPTRVPEPARAHVTPAPTAAIPTAQTKTPQTQTAQTQTAQTQTAQTQTGRVPPLVPRPQAEPQAPAKPEAVAPVAMAGILTRKPPSAKMRITAMGGPGGKILVTAALPNLPQPEALQVRGGLALASVVDWDPACDMRESGVHKTEARVELKTFVPSPPVMELGIGVSGTGAWNFAAQAVDMPIADGVSANAPALWQAPPCDFAASVIALGGLAALQFSTTGFDQPQTGARPPIEAPVPGTGMRPVLEPLPESTPEPPLEPTPQVLAEAKEKQSVPNPAGQPISVVVQATAAGKARPAQVFTSSLLSGLPIQVPKSEALPLRPMMIMGSAPTPSVTAKSRKPDVRILAPEKPVAGTPAVEMTAPEKPVLETRGLPRIEGASRLNERPTESVSVSLAQPVPKFDLGLPKLQTKTPSRSILAQVWKIMGGTVGGGIV